MHSPHGLIDQSSLGRKNDYLYRLSLKGLILNERNEVLVVKESGRNWWDLPGGGMDHDENIKHALARELFEEVSLQGDFTYHVIDIDEPVFLANANVWQVRIIFQVMPTAMIFTPGEDGDAIEFKSIEEFEHSSIDVERRIYRYITKL